MGQHPCCGGLKVVVFLGVGGVHGPGFFAGCEQLQFDDVFGQAGVSSRLVVLSQDVFVSHSACPPVVMVVPTVVQDPERLLGVVLRPRQRFGGRRSEAGEAAPPPQKAGPDTLWVRSFIKTAGATRQKFFPDPVCDFRSYLAAFCDR